MQSKDGGSSHSKITLVRIGYDLMNCENNLLIQSTIPICILAELRTMVTNQCVMDHFGFVM